MEQPIKKFLALREALKNLKGAGATESDARVSFVIDSNLSKLFAEHGASDDCELSDFERTRAELANKYTMEDEEGRGIYRIIKGGSVHLMSHDPEAQKFVDPETGDELGVARAVEGTEYKVLPMYERGGSFEKELESILETKKEISLMTLSREEFFDAADLSGIQGEVDLSALEIMFEG